MSLKPRLSCPHNDHLTKPKSFDDLYIILLYSFSCQTENVVHVERTTCRNKDHSNTFPMILLGVMSSCYSRILIFESYDNIDREIAFRVPEATIGCTEGHTAISR